MRRLDRLTRRWAVVAAVGFAMSSVAVATGSELGDEEMERFLLEAEVVAIHRVIGSSTYPMALNLKMEGKARRAAFKYGDIQDEEGDPWVDSYRHEVAAYRLDRALGLHMVPVAVLRKVKTDGAVIEWISAAFNEQERRERGVDPPDPQWLIFQQAKMGLFDALILNRFRDETDQLIEPESWNLRLIDHSRAFPESTELPPSFLSRPAILSRAFLRNLEALHEQSLVRLLDGLLDRGQIRALLMRRDKILDKIDADRQRYGDARVLHE